MIGGHDPHPNTPANASGAALIIDYSNPARPAAIPSNTLRGIANHRRVSPFAHPGRTDLSADVDFQGVLEAALDASQGVECHGPVEQGFWLRGMGGGTRVERLVDAAAATAEGGKDEDVAARVRRSWDRLTDRGPNGMGKVYKVLAVLPEGGGERRPVGFGGDI